MGRGKLLAVFATAGLALGGAVAARAAAVPSRPHPAIRPGAVVIHRVGQPLARIRAFWTRERLQLARPVAFQPAGRRIPLPAPARRGISVPGAAPLRVPLAQKRSRIWTTHGRMPATTIGKLFFVAGDAGAGFCSATVIRAPNRNTIWTAAHCVSNGDGTWYTNFIFQPDLHNGIAPFGSFVPAYVATTAGYFYQGEPAYDVAALAMSPRGKSLQSRVGAQGVKIGGSSYRWRHVYDFGYPADLFPPAVSVDSGKLRYCTVRTSRDREANMMRFQCNLGHGSSGGPLLWRLRHRRGWGYLIGNMSMGEIGSYLRWSPQLGDAALHVYNAIKNK